MYLIFSLIVLSVYIGYNYIYKSHRDISTEKAQYIKTSKELIDEYQIDSILNSSLVKVSCEIQYLNVFNHIFKVEDKEYFFEKYNYYISENLLSNSASAGNYAFQVSDYTSVFESIAQLMFHKNIKLTENNIWH